MKKSITLSITLVALLSTIIAVYFMNATASSENSLLLANIEALSDEEGGSGGNWLKGYKMNSMYVYVGFSAGVTVGVSRSSGTSFGLGVTVEYRQIYCCEKVDKGTDCNKDGNYPECSYLAL